MSASVPACFHRRGEGKQRFIRILLVDADTAFHRHRNADGRFHGGNAVGDQRRLRHQAGAETALLHPVGGAADIEIDLVEACVFADARRLGERARVAAAKLQRHRMLERIEGEKPGALAPQHRAGGQHFRVEQRPAREQAMEEPAMPVGPFHHRRYGKAPTIHFAIFSCHFRHLTAIRQRPISAHRRPFANR